MPAVLVTGASTGIGAAVARRLATDGHDVAVHFHQDRAGAKDVAGAVEVAGREAVVLQADLAKPAAARRVAEEALAALPDLQGVVNNAGVYLRAGVDEAGPDVWRRTLQVDLEAPFHVLQPLLPTLRGCRGAVVNIASIAAFRGSAHGAHYAAAKAGLIGLTHALAVELAPDVRVNAVAPGYIDTVMLGADTPEKRRRRESEVPLGRIGRPEDVAGAVAFLLGADAGYVTGQTLHVNGGLWPANVK